MTMTTCMRKTGFIIKITNETLSWQGRFDLNWLSNPFIPAQFNGLHLGWRGWHTRILHPYTIGTPLMIAIIGGATGSIATNLQKSGA